MEMDSTALRNFSDFLQLYNKMTEICFARCIDSVNSRSLEQNEIDCVDSCSSKFIKYNNKLMQNFVKAQTDIVNKRVEDTEKQQRLESASSIQENQTENNLMTEGKLQLENGSLQEERIVNENVISK